MFASNLDEGLEQGHGTQGGFPVLAVKGREGSRLLQSHVPQQRQAGFSGPGEQARSARSGALLDEGVQEDGTGTLRSPPSCAGLGSVPAPHKSRVSLPWPRMVLKCNGAPQINLQIQRHLCGNWQTNQKFIWQCEGPRKKQRKFLEKNKVDSRPAWATLWDLVWK